jgi:4-hydroxythreonine-4-phosphate dehydrogenase
MTEYFAAKTKRTNQELMLIYNKNLAVSPLTTHLPLKKIFKKISKERIIFQVKKINEFYKKYLKKKPNIALTGLNPHCETLDKFSEEEKIINPAIKKLKQRNIKIFGPFPADTIFLKKNYKHYDVIVGMYHDQVLTPLKSLYEFNAINITIGLPFIRITVDHGPNNKMIGKNLSSPISLIEAINFTKNLRDI